MDELRWLRLVAHALIVGAVVAGGMLLTTHPLAVVAAEPAASIGRARNPGGSAAFDSIISASAAEAPFRASRAPAFKRYDPRAGDIDPDPGTPPAPKPRLRLTGIVWSGRPSAVIEGLPGSSGPRVVQDGDVVGELRVRRVAPEHVTVVGMDTVWVLTVEEPWQGGR